MYVDKSPLTTSKFAFIPEFKCLHLPTLQFNGSTEISFIETCGVPYCCQLEGGHWITLIGSLELIGEDH